MQASCKTAVISLRVAPALSARWMCRRTPGAYMCVHDTSTAMPISSIVFASSAPATAGVIAIAITLSVHAGSSFANGSQSGFQLPVTGLRSRVRRGRDLGELLISVAVRSMGSGRLRLQFGFERRFNALQALQVGQVGSCG